MTLPTFTVLDHEMPEAKANEIICLDAALRWEAFARGEIEGEETGT